MRVHFRHLFTPHHSNNHRPRILHPAGFAVLVALFIMFQAMLHLWRMTGVQPGGFVLGFASSITTSQAVEQTNQRRLTEGLPPLKQNSVLSQAAAAKAAHMFENGYWAHIAPDGTTPWQFIVDSGYRYSVAGENLARDFSNTEAMVQAWMDSETHRENIMNPDYLEIGIAVVDGQLEGTDTTLVVQMFGAPISTVPQTPELAASDTAGAQEVAQPAELTPESAVLAEAEAPETVHAETSDTALPNVTLSQGQRLGEATVGAGSGGLRVSPLMLTKVLGSAILLLLFLVLLLDTHTMKRLKIPRTVGKNWAHISFFSLVVMAMILVTNGVIR